MSNMYNQEDYSRRTDLCSYNLWRRSSHSQNPFESKEIQSFFAETAGHLVCRRHGVENATALYWEHGFDRVNIPRGLRHKTLCGEVTVIFWFVSPCFCIFSLFVSFSFVFIFSFFLAGCHFCCFCIDQIVHFTFIRFQNHGGSESSSQLYAGARLQRRRSWAER